MQVHSVGDGMPRWSGLMALGWVGSRDIALVGRLRPDGDSKPRLVRLTVELALLSGRGQDNGATMGSVAAEEHLLGALSQGTVPAFGVPAGQSLPVRIPAYEWDALRFREDGEVVTRQGYELAYRDLQIDRTALVAAFPSHAEPFGSAAEEDHSPPSQGDVSGFAAPPDQVAIKLAIQALWPEWVGPGSRPTALRAAEIHDRIQRHLHPAVATPSSPHPRTIRRALKRFGLSK